ncbi:hypothetical protein ACWDOP_07480 [Nocardia sp. NPDC003693]
MVKIDVLFTRRPERWGLRGDPRLWEALHEKLGSRSIPDGEYDLRRVLEESIAEIIGTELPLSVPATDAAHFPVERFRIGSGMSDGVVSLHWWRYTGIPMLTDRAAGVRAGEYVVPIRRK